jgi:hypothetical protein
MDKLDSYRKIIENTLSEIVQITERSSSASPHIKDKAIFDRHADSYLIVREGWEGPRHIDCIVAHVEILNDKVWIQEDGIEYGIASYLEKAGIPKSDIVLGFQPPDVRPFTEYAAA